MYLMDGGNVQNGTSNHGYILELLYAHKLKFASLITTNFGRRAKVCFEITLAFAAMSVLHVFALSFVWGETFQSELIFLSIIFIRNSASLELLGFFKILW